MTSHDYLAAAFALQEEVRASQALERALLAEHESAAAQRTMVDHLLVELRCVKGNCVLLQVWRAAAADIAWFTPSYKMSDARTAATSSLEGLAANADASGRWRSQAGPLTDSAVLIQCNHRSQSPIAADDLWSWVEGALASGRLTRRGL